MAGQSGVERGTIVAVLSDGKVMVEVPVLGRGVQFGPLDVLTGPVLTAGQRCVVASVHGSPDDLVVLGVLGTPPVP